MDPERFDESVPALLGCKGLWVYGLLPCIPTTPPPRSPRLYALKVSIDPIIAAGADIDLIELRTLKPVDMETIAMSLRRTHKVG